MFTAFIDPTASPNPDAIPAAVANPPLALRPAQPGDAAAMQAFVNGLGGASRRSRFHGSVARCSDRPAASLVQADGVRQVVWVACHPHDGQDGQQTIVGEARYVRAGANPQLAELAIAVADAWQGRGVADALMRQLIQSAGSAGVTGLFADMLESNTRMQAFMRRHGFSVTDAMDADVDGVRLERYVAGPRRPGPSVWRRAWSRVRAQSRRGPALTAGPRLVFRRRRASPAACCRRRLRRAPALGRRAMCGGLAEYRAGQVERSNERGMDRRCRRHAEPGMASPTEATPSRR